MIRIQKDRVTLIFGSADTSFIPREIKEQQISCIQLAQVAPFSQMQFPALQSIIFLHQVHGTDGVIIKDSQQVTFPFDIEGDFLCTDQKDVGLAVATGDCVPIIIYSTDPCIVSVIHAGWRGTVNGIAQKAVKKLMSSFRCSSDQLYAYIGPYAHSCCYEVGDEVVKAVRSWGPIYEKSLVCRVQSWFFDTGLFNEVALERIGVPSGQISIVSSLCTICNDVYCSFRRNKTLDRQFSMVYLT